MRLLGVSTLAENICKFVATELFPIPFAPGPSLRAGQLHPAGGSPLLSCLLMLLVFYILLNFVPFWGRISWIQALTTSLLIFVTQLNKIIHYKACFAVEDHVSA